MGRCRHAEFSAAEAALLRRAWQNLWPVSKILAELAPRRPKEILRQIDLMLSAPARGYDGDGIWTELDRALLALPGRIQRVPKCPLGFRLDGRPAGAAQVVAAANVFLRSMGYEPVIWPSVRHQTNGVR
ncbi:MAG: hypothetical protein M0006_02385 [Magnetospirillum sp.]|nr:hypothetical protein [Magnetospirillum sp.]